MPTILVGIIDSAQLNCESYPATALLQGLAPTVRPILVTMIPQKVNTLCCWAMQPTFLKAQMTMFWPPNSRPDQI